MIQILAAASRRRVTAKDGVSRARLFLIALGPPRADWPYSSRNLTQSKHKSNKSERLTFERKTYLNEKFRMKNLLPIAQQVDS